MNMRTLFTDLARRGESVLIIDEDGVSAHGLSPTRKQAKNAPLSIDLTFTDAPARASVYFFVNAEHAPLDVALQVRLSSNANVRITEYHVARNQHSISWREESHLAEGATLSTTVLIDMEGAAIDMRRKSTIEQNAAHYHALAAFTAETSRIDTNIELSGLRAKADVSAAVLAEKGDVLCKTSIEHTAPDSEGFIRHSGVALATGTLIFEGTGSIRAGMRGSVARQETKGIVIGSRARLDAYPLLYIDEHDVTASHGAAIGQIDENQLHYMMSRGLRRKDAERLIIGGYFHGVARALHQPELGDRLRALLSASIK